MELQHISLPTVSGAVTAEYLIPDGEQKVGAIVIAHEWWGINDDIRRITKEFSQQGWIALAVDLYHGKSTTDPAEAMALSNDLKTAVAIEDMRAAVRWLQSHPRCNGKVAVTGFCLGGAMALAAACNIEELSASVPFYGLGVAAFTDFTKTKVPILGHFAKNDPFIPMERVESVFERAQKANAQFELHYYNAGHAFMRASDPDAYHAESAQQAWARTIAFLQKHL